MRKRQAFVPAALDRLEDRVALSHGMMPSVSAQVGRQVVGALQTRTIDLRGTVYGNVLPRRTAPGVPGMVRLYSIRSFVSPLGKASTDGPLSIGSGDRSVYDGTVNLTNIFNRGASVRVHISGTQGGPAGRLANLRYEILGGRGAFRGVNGMGEAVLIQYAPSDGGGRARFTLTFGPSTPATT